MLIGSTWVFELPLGPLITPPMQSQAVLRHYKLTHTTLFEGVAAAEKFIVWYVAALGPVCSTSPRDGCRGTFERVPQLRTQLATHRAACQQACTVTHVVSYNTLYSTLSNKPPS